MKLVVVGGHTRNIGKTSVAAGLIAGTRELGWTALKLTQYGHNICSADGRACDCAPENPEHPFSIDQEQNSQSRTDTSRFLAAGAVESYWVRTFQGRLSDALPSIRELIAEKPYVLMESNSIVRFLEPDLYLVVLDSRKSDFKRSAREGLDLADAFAVLEAAPPEPAWENVPSSRIARRPVFPVRPPEYFTSELLAFVRSKLV